MKNLLKRFAPELMFTILAANGLIAVISGLTGYAQIPFNKTLSKAIGILLIGITAAIFYASQKALGEGIKGRVEPRCECQELITSGIYSYVRHPLYLAFFIGLLAIDVMARSYLAFAMTVLLALPSLLWRARVEDSALKERFGQQWESYACNVPAFIPRLTSLRQRESFSKLETHNNNDTSD